MNYLALAGFIALAGCNVPADEHHNDPHDPVTETVSIERGNTEMVRMELKMSAGELHLRGGASKLLEGTVSYNQPFLKPTVRYDSTGFRGHLTIDQESAASVKLGGNLENRWDFRANNETPIDLILNMGAGESTLDLGSLVLRRLDVRIGVGKLNLDLRGTPQKDYDVEIRGGVGEANVHLPSGVGVVVNARGGIGEISTRGDGLRKDGSSYVNDHYGKSSVTVRVDIQGGIGKIELITD